jgi:hypothetical protein
MKFAGVTLHVRIHWTSSASSRLWSEKEDEKRHAGDQNRERKRTIRLLEKNIFKF